MPRAYWKGYLRLSAGHLPGRDFSRDLQSGRTHFHQINRKTGNRLRQQMVDEETGKAVDKDDKGRGYEVSKGKYVEIEPEETQAVQIESTHTIDIDKLRAARTRSTGAISTGPTTSRRTARAARKPLPSSATR